MDKITRESALSILERDNPAFRRSTLTMYADAFVDYQEAESNISKNGAIVAHPRTGTPIDNPYLRVRNQAARVMAGKPFANLRSEVLWGGKPPVAEARRNPRRVPIWAGCTENE